MRSGFLGTGTGPKAAGKVDATANPVSDPETQAAPKLGQPVDATASPPVSADQTARNLQQCLALLEGPTDERRFVGLLLVTKILPAGDVDVIKEVFDAVGFTFLSRLVLPLLAGKTNNPLVAEPEALQKAAATARLGIAVLSSFARVPELAVAEEMVEKLPLFLKVARAGGVLPILHEAVPVAPAVPAAPSAEQHPPQPNERLQSASQQPAAAAVGVQAEEPQAEAASVVDALECALCVAQSGAEGRHVALESGALRTALVVLQRALASIQQATEQAQQRQKQQAVRECLLVVRLLSVVLAGPEGAAGISGSVDLVVNVVPHLVGLLALPAFPPAANGKPAVTAQPGSSANTAAGPAADVAALQLEALHVLHLLLVHASMNGVCPASHAALADAAARAAEQAQPAGRGWPAYMRLGLELVLRSRVSPVERHAALQIAAALADLAGPDWLLGEAGSQAAAPGPTASRPGVRSSSSSSSSSGSEGSTYSSGSFFQLVVEMTKIETSVLLLDALAPDARVPLGDWAPAPAPTALGSGAPGSEEGSDEGTEEAGMAEVEHPQHSEHAGSEVVLSDMEVEGSAASGLSAAAASSSSSAAQAARGSSADVGVLQRVLESDAERAKLEQRMRQGSAAAGERGAARPEAPGSLAQRVDEMELPTRSGAAGATGPTELAGERAARLLPSCFALLEACIEALASSMEKEEELDEGGTQEGPSPAPQLPLAAPLLPPGVALRALSSLQEVCEGLLQFLEQTVGRHPQQEQQPGRGEGETPESLGAVQGALAAAAVRVIGRFCAEVPEAFGPRLRQLLPRLLAVPPGAGTGGGGDLLPFLLPLLVQVVGPGAAVGEQEQAAWLAVLRGPEVLPHLASFVDGAASDVLENYPPGSLGGFLDAVLAQPQRP